jgi:hypothetical protein
MDSKAEFPVGHGAQDYWIGDPIEASDLKAMPLRDRVERVVTAINALGGAHDAQTPLPPDPDLTDRVARWQRRTGADEAFAVAWQVLETVADPSEDTMVLRLAAQTGGYSSDGTPRGDWLAAIAGRMFGPGEAAPGSRPDADRPVVVSSITVSRSTHPHLADHAIAGKPVVPVAYAVEWFARAAIAHEPDRRLVELSDITMLRGVVLDNFAGGTDLDLDVTARTVDRTSDECTLQLELVDPTTGRSRYRCSATLSDRPPTPAAAGSGPVNPFGEFGQPPGYGDALFHGPRFQMIESIAVDPSAGLSARLRGVAELSWPAEAWTTDPALVDGALQMALLWTRQLLGKASLPTGVDRIRLLAGPVGGWHTATLVGREASRDRVVCDVRVRDEAGTVVVEMLGIETHALPGVADA